eukprot:gnl/TRDRNA2_/TRDRNA2_180679_c0_seq1.p1 gnl/TRDRNA2_/TRDRNA2_180679_c0~~gnl/TRDRNA2_/TRDRNA2_180679_c0_seq1.p1  ORF type:complete len:340 (+),score=87.71 gnl/TRDRNA2_/TRDRNA2_180679_c0_seq1:119-1138(+)
MSGVGDALHDITNSPTEGLISKHAGLCGAACVAGDDVGHFFLTCMIEEGPAPAPWLEANIEETADDADMTGDRSNCEADPAADYVADILSVYERLGEEAASATVLPSSASPVKVTPDVDTAGDRAVVVDSLVEVGSKLKLKTQTLFLAVSIFDRFVVSSKSAKEDFQLVGISALFVAAKFEEEEPPEIRDFVFATKHVCTREAMLQMEFAMLQVLEFCLCRPTAAHFLERCLKAFNSGGKAAGHLLQYVLELGLLDVRVSQHSPAHQVAAASLVSSRVVGQPILWPAAVVRRTEQTEQIVRLCAKDMWCLLKAEDWSACPQVHKKFSRPEYSGVASVKV